MEEAKEALGLLRLVELRESGLRPEQLAIDFEMRLLIWLEQLLAELKLYSIRQK
jgi:hypothetical protein